MNDLQIFQLMLKTPGIRAVQIADWLDKELAEVSNALRELVDAGNIVKSKGLAPNGQQAMVYDFSAEFKASREYSALVALTAAAAPAPVQEPATPTVLEAAAPAPAAPVETAAPAAGAGPSRAERAIEAILARGPLSDAELRVVMDLKDQVYPSTYLGPAVRACKVHKGTDGWMAGPIPTRLAPVTPPRFNTPINPTKPAPAGFEERAKVDQVQSGVSIGKVVIGPAPRLGAAAEVFSTITAAELQGLPESVVAELSKPAQALAASIAETTPPATPAVFRCGLWSDGVIELQRNGAEVARLTRGEGEELAAFLSRMLVTSTRRLQFEGMV